MNLKEVGGSLIACKTALDIVHGLEGCNEFLVSERVAEELRKNPNFMSEGYWYLAIGKYEDSDQMEWEISIYEVSVQVPLRGYISFDSGSPTLLSQ